LAAFEHPVKFVLRQLAKNPGFTVFALVTLALGIGVNTTSFSVLNRMLLQSLPYRDPDRLVLVWRTDPRSWYLGQTPGDFMDEREQNTVFEAMAAYYPYSTGSLAEPGKAPIRVPSTRVSKDFFPMMGVRPQLGRLFTADDEAHASLLILVSNTFWHEHYASDPNILGRIVRINAKDYAIVGVMPPALDDSTLFGGRPAFWPLDDIGGVNRQLRSIGWYRVAARLKPDVTIQQAQSAMNVLAKRLAHDYPKTNATRGLFLAPFPKNTLGNTGAQLTWLVLGLSGMVLLIACVNLANLQLVRTTRRAKEFGIRLALGCSRRRLIAMLLLESLVLSAAGGALSLLVAAWSNSYVAHYFNVDMPMDLRVLGFAFAASMATGAIFGTVPAWIASRADVANSLKSSGRAASSDRSRHWLRQGLVVVELCLALTLLAGAGFFVTGIYKLTHRDLGWDPNNKLVGFIELDNVHYGDRKDPRSLAFGERMREALRALPGVRSVAFGIDSPAWGLRERSFMLEGEPPPEPGKEHYAGSTSATQGYLAMYGVRLVQGRDFLDSDRPGAPPVAIVNEAFARKYWPGQNPIGKRIGDTDPGAPNWSVVVGVMNDFKGSQDFYNPGADQSKFLIPWAQNNNRFIGFHIETAGDPAAMEESIRKAMGILAPDFALSDLSTVSEVLADELSYYSFLRRLLIQISVLGLLLAAVGIYGVVANLASERTKEIGIRMALGAQSGSIVWLFVRNGILLALIGTGIGLATSILLLNMLVRMLPFLPGNDPRAIACVSVAMVAVSLFACWLPARRTTRVDPTIALRAE
jgi:putative ABC transport system permease protein